MLKYFEINVTRDLLIPDVQFYQMSLDGPVQYALEHGEFEDELPSWNKFVAHPNKAKGFFTNVLSALFLGHGGYDEINVDLQSGVTEMERTRVAMMFMPGNTRSDMLQMIESIANQALPGFYVVNISGGSKYNGVKITNRNAERITKEIVHNARERGQSVLIIAAQMAQRSFSIPEITELYLAYDRGSNGATIQKMSRTLTPDDVTKVGRVYSLSFDMNRDDKFDSMLLETIINYSKAHKSKSAKESMQDVLRTIDIFKCTGAGAIKVDADTYLEEALARKSISRVIGKSSDLTRLNPAEISALATGNSDYFRTLEVDSTEKGKTRPPRNKDPRKRNLQDRQMIRELSKAREVIVAIVENIDYLIMGSNTNTLQDAIDAIRKDDTLKESVLIEFGLSFDVIEYLFRNNVINQNLLELLYDE